MKADLILVDLEEVCEDPWISSDLSIAEAFIHRAKGSHVNTVLVGGNVVMEDMWKVSIRKCERAPQRVSIERRESLPIHFRKSNRTTRNGTMDGKIRNTGHTI